MIFSELNNIISYKNRKIVHADFQLSDLVLMHLIGPKYTGIIGETVYVHNKLAASRQNQHNGFATSIDPDQSAQSDQDPCCSLSVSLLVIGFVSEQHGSRPACA
jgi:hypothetical protein